MNRDAIYALVTKLLFGYAMDVNLFYSFLDIAQDQVESMRPWMILREEDATLTASAGTTFTTPFALAPTNSDFKKWYGDFPVVLTDTNNNPVPFREVPIAQKFTFKLQGQKFFCDYAANRFYLCGTLNQSYAIHQFYIKKSLRISLASSNTWVFDTYGYSYSALLAYLCAMQWKGVDYDIINLQNAGHLGDTAKGILDGMTRWDSDLQASGQVGFDPFGEGDGWTGNQNGGRLSI